MFTVSAKNYQQDFQLAMNIVAIIIRWNEQTKRTSLQIIF